MAAGVDENNLLGEFSDFTPDPPKMRDMCWRCSRPAVTCWCNHLPDPPINTSTTIIILQHPYEEGRRLKTAPMLHHGLAEGRCHIFAGKYFSLAKYPLVAAAVNRPERCLLMFPSGSAVDLDAYLELAGHVENQEQVIDHKVNQEEKPTDLKKVENAVKEEKGYTLILLDGTWFQARGIYGKNKYLHTLKQVKLSNTGLSEYVIRTQPNDASLSTLECAAIALAKLERDPHIKERLVAPLRALCRYQMEYGAVTHHSKQYLIEHGLYQKQVSKLQLKKFIETGGNKLRPKGELERNCNETSEPKGNELQTKDELQGSSNEIPEPKGYELRTKDKLEGSSNDKRLKDELQNHEMETSLNADKLKDDIGTAAEDLGTDCDLGCDAEKKIGALQIS